MGENKNNIGDLMLNNDQIQYIVNSLGLKLKRICHTDVYQNKQDGYAIIYDLLNEINLWEVLFVRFYTQ